MSNTNNPSAEIVDRLADPDPASGQRSNRIRRLLAEQRGAKQHRRETMDVLDHNDEDGTIDLTLYHAVTILVWVEGSWDHCEPYMFRFTDENGEPVGPVYDVTQGFVDELRALLRDRPIPRV